MRSGSAASGLRRLRGLLAQGGEPLVLFVEQAGQAGRALDDLGQHPFARVGVLRDLVVELLADRERGRQLGLRGGQRRAQRIDVRRIELGLGEPELLLGVADGVVRRDQQGVRLAGELAGPPVALLGLQPAELTPSPPGPQQRQPGEQQDDADDDARPRPEIAGRLGDGAAGFRRDDRRGRGSGRRRPSRPSAAARP